MNFNKVKEIVKNEFVNSNLEYNLEFENGYFEFNVWDENCELKEEFIMDFVENCLYKIMECLDEKYKEEFEDCINSDFWFSGYENVEDNELVFCKKNVLSFNFEFDN